MLTSLSRVWLLFIPRPTCVKFFLFSSPVGLLCCYTTPREYNISLRMMIGAQGNPPKKKKKKMRPALTFYKFISTQHKMFCFLWESFGIIYSKKIVAIPTQRLSKISITWPPPPLPSSSSFCFTFCRIALANRWNIKNIFWGSLLNRSSHGLYSSLIYSLLHSRLTYYVVIISGIK